MDTTSSEGPLIWVIDKDPDYCILLSEILKRWEYRVKCFTSRAEVIEQLETPLLPALIIMDVIMRGSEQPTIMEILRDQKALRKTPLVIITGGAPLELMEGATERHLKPVPPVTMKKIVDRYCIGGYKA